MIILQGLLARLLLNRRLPCLRLLTEWPSNRSVTSFGAPHAVELKQYLHNLHHARPSQVKPMPRISDLRMHWSTASMSGREVDLADQVIVQKPLKQFLPAVAPPFGTSDRM